MSEADHMGSIDTYYADKHFHEKEKIARSKSKKRGKNNCKQCERLAEQLADYMEVGK